MKKRTQPSWWMKNRAATGMVLLLLGLPACEKSATGLFDVDLDTDGWCLGGLPCLDGPIDPGPLLKIVTDDRLCRPFPPFQSLVVVDFQPPRLPPSRWL